MSDGDEELPAKVDVLVLGTGLPESILAAACARAGLSVLHLDRNDYYGGAWSSFHLHSIVEWIEARQATRGADGCVAAVSDELVGQGERVLRPSHTEVFRNVRLQSQFGDLPDGEASDLSAAKQLWEGTEKHWRKFSLDLLPKVLLSRGAMVRVLCDAEVCNYCEFKCVDRFLSLPDDVAGGASTCGGLQSLPCSRSEVFISDSLSMLEKRRIMRFLTSCANPSGDFGPSEELSQLTFDEFLESRDIVGNLKRFITDSVGILEPNTTALKGLDAIHRFIGSVGRYGNSPFLWTLYGSGELPQCFCRLCAVFGGIYCLHRSVDAFVLNANRIVGVVSNGRRIECGHVVMNASYVPADYLESTEERQCVQRAIAITDRSLLPDSHKEHISLLNLTRLNSGAYAFLIETSFEACTAPKGYYVCHLTASRPDAASRDVLSPILERLFRTRGSQSHSGQAENDERPQLLWCLLFDVFEGAVDQAALPVNVRVVPTVDGDLEYSKIVDRVRSIFMELWPELDFLPMSLRRREEEGEGEDEQQRDGSEQAVGANTNAQEAPEGGNETGEHTQ